MSTPEERKRISEAKKKERERVATERKKIAEQKKKERERSIQPPQPGPGCRKLAPILVSDPIPKTTSLMSAPTPSQIAAMALIKDNLVARNALAAYLMVSAEAGSVMMIFADKAS